MMIKVIEMLIGERRDALLNDNYEYAGALRQFLFKAGITLEDTPEGTRWKKKEEEWTIGTHEYESEKKK